MIELLVGFGLGAMALTSTGREVGNKIGGAALELARKGADRAKSSKQPPRASGDDHHHR